MKKTIIFVRSIGIGDLIILLANIHAISRKINNKVTVVAQKNTHANFILQNDPHIEEVIILDKKEIKGKRWDGGTTGLQSVFEPF